MQPTLPTQPLDVVGIDDTKLQPELFQHLQSPLLLQRGWAEYEHGAGAVPDEHLLQDQSCLDGLAEPYTIGDQKVSARHVDGTHQWIELEVLDAYATSKGR